jgi:hypothetical protein
MKAPHRIVLEKTGDMWIVRDRLEGEYIRIGSTTNIRSAADMAAEFVTAYDKNEERKANERFSVNDSN